MKDKIVKFILNNVVNTPQRREWISRHLALQLRNDVTKRLLKENVGEVLSGAFRGLKVPQDLTTRNFSSAHIFGTYEKSVVDKITSIVGDYKRFIDIGCGGGYFTNGVACLNDMDVIGFDIDPKMIEQADIVREANNNSKVKHILVDEKTRYDEILKLGDLVLIDIEGAEYNVLKPDLYPNLLNADYIIELDKGDGYDDITGKDELIRRFSDTHNFTIIDQHLDLTYTDEIFSQFKWLSNYMIHAAVFEYRRVPQRWLMLTHKN